ncbi:hypothetical protein ACFL6U_15605 [Planctomycetota bacterium]
MKNETTIGLGPDKIAQLLGVSLDADLDETDEVSSDAAGQLLDAHLAGVLPLDTAAVDKLPVMLGKLNNGDTPSLGAVLTSNNSSLKTIRKIRRYAKSTAARHSSPAQHAAITAIYFAAIANALVFHDRKLSSYSYADLVDSFNDLLDKSWIPENLIMLFKQAQQICHNKAG